MTKDGYAFGGWYTEAGFTTLWNFATDTVSGNTILYAKWSEQFFQFTVQTTAANETFFIPVGGYLNDPSTVKPYTWNIDWGDGSVVQNASGSSASNSAGIDHAYATAGTYRITITPAGSEDAWLGAFGFGTTFGTNSQANRNRLVSVDSPIRPLMTRTQAQLDAGTAPSYEWAYTFYGCQNPAFTMGPDFTFSSEWAGITTAGDSFAYNMFSGCSGAVFTMNDVFNLPSNISTADFFFAYYMFYYCSGAAFTMNDIFNLPQNITTAGSGFAYHMFYNCSGAAFTMNDIFNLPQNITTVDDYFACGMFYYCSGAGFLVNGVFKFPPSGSSGTDAFKQTFSLGSSTHTQTRTAESIINGRAAPGSDMNTFGPAGAWSDYNSINVNWRE
jgi:uncharacterized repeat protein (TIGR02543 family)